MGKRSNFERNTLDFYPTPKAAILPLIDRYDDSKVFCEPCAGDGTLIKHLEDAGFKCVSAFDVDPKADGIARHDASFMKEDDLNGAQVIITNPPWDRHALHQIIERGITLRPAWYLFDADWPHTKQASRLIKFCTDIIAIGRVKWIEGSLGAGKDNACWYRFDTVAANDGPRFWGRS